MSNLEMGRGLTAGKTKGNTIYPPEVVAIMEREWAKGTSSAAIGRMVNMSKNQVLGYAHRHKDKFPERPSPLKGGAKRQRRPFDQARLPTCQWIDGDPKTSSKCGKPGYPYCEEHHQRAYVRVPRKHYASGAYKPRRDGL